MATFVIGVSASSAADFQAALNSALSTLLNVIVLDVQFNVGDAAQVNGIEYSAVIQYDDGASTMTAPFTAVVIEARTATEVATRAQNLIAGSPTQWFSTVFAGYEVNDGRRTQPYSALLFSNVDPANAVNWQIGGGSLAYSNPAPMPTTVGGYLAGTTFPTPRTMQQMWDGLLYAYLSPAFTSFSDSGVPNPLEVGATIPAAATFVWGTSNAGNVQPNSISIQDVTGGVSLGTGLPNSGSYATTLPGGPITRTSIASYTFRINGVNTHLASFNRNATYNWQWRKFWGNNGASVPSGAQINALANSALATSYPGSYSTAAGGFKFICFADAAGDQLNSVTDPSTGFPVAMVTPAADPAYSNLDGGGFYYALVSVTNVNGVTTNYRVYRTYYSLGGALTMNVT